VRSLHHARCAAALATLLVGRPAAALSPDKDLGQCSIQTWQVKDGLPGNSIHALAQSNDSYLWVATLGGLVKYDGSTFTRVAVPPSLAGGVNDSSTLLAARDGSVWVGSTHHPPVRFRQGTVRSYGPQDGLPDRTFPSAWAEDSRGQIWLASSRGLYRFAEERFVAHAVRDLDRPAQLDIDAGGTFWVGIDRGLFSIVGDQLARPPGLEKAGPISALWRDHRSVLWASTPGVLIGVDGHEVITVPGLPSGPAAAITEDGDGNLWVGTPQGLVRVRDGRARLYTVKDGLPDNDVTALLIDRERSLWIGTRSGGLAQVSDRTLDARSLGPGLEGLEGRSVCEDDEGGLWFGTRNRGAVRWKGQARTIYTTADGLPADAVQALSPGGPGEVWLGTTAGLARFSGGRLQPQQSWPRAVSTLFRDDSGTLWIGGEGELGRLRGSDLTVFRPEQGMLSGQIRGVAVDGQGVVWVLGLGGLVRSEGQHFVKADPLAAFDRKGPVRSLYRDRQGALWLTATRAGLVRVSGGRPFVFDDAVGFDVEMPYQMLEDDNGDFWIGTNNSVVRVSRASLDLVAERKRPAVAVATFETTTMHAGVVAAAPRQPGAWKAADGRLWFVTQQGAVTIDPRHVQVNTVAPHLRFDAVLVDGRNVYPGPTELPPSVERVEFQYGAMTLLQGSKVRYRYQLEGFDRDWVEAGARRTAVYTGLRPGPYHFQLQGANSDGVWNERGVNYRFSVRAPFYRQYWFYLMGALAVLGAVLLAQRARVIRIRAQYMLLFTERARMARELHDTLLQGISAVSMQLNALRARLADAPEGRELAMVQQAVSRCLDETRRVVRGLREEGRVPELGPALGRLARRLCAAAPMECQVEVLGTPRGLAHDTEDELYRIAQEAITNALKHADATQVTVSLRYEPDGVVLTVSDDGRGFEAEGRATAAAPGDHFGLIGMRERAARIGAALTVTSQPGHGTVVEARVPARATAS
jgi:signal transduction histidine kinase/ligand-binding sensor domain-containing protein